MFTTIHQNYKSYLKKKKAIHQALQCNGWTDRKKLGALYDFAEKTEALAEPMLEIGSAWGRSTVLLGLASQKDIWSVDPHTGGLGYIQKGEQQNSYEIFRENLSLNGLAERVNILKYTSAEVQERGLLPSHLMFSLVFIDGLHTAEGVEIDFNLMLGRVVDGGCVVFDDYFEPSVPEFRAKIDQLTHASGFTLIKDASSRLVYFYKNIRSTD